jgi:hypothetical protein
VARTGAVLVIEPALLGLPCIRSGQIDPGGCCRARQRTGLPGGQSADADLPPPSGGAGVLTERGT